MSDYVRGDERNPEDVLNIVINALERFCLKLLDITRRNNLISFRETRRTIRIIDELPDETYRQLVTEGKSMELLQYEPPPVLDQNAQGNNKQGTLLFDDKGEMNYTPTIDEDAGKMII